MYTPKKDIPTLTPEVASSARPISKMNRETANALFMTLGLGNNNNNVFKRDHTPETLAGCFDPDETQKIQSAVYQGMANIAKIKIVFPEIDMNEAEFLRYIDAMVVDFGFLARHIKIRSERMLYFTLDNEKISGKCEYGGMDRDTNTCVPYTFFIEAKKPKTRYAWREHAQIWGYMLSGYQHNIHALGNYEFMIYGVLFNGFDLEVYEMGHTKVDDKYQSYLKRIVKVAESEFLSKNMVQWFVYSLAYINKQIATISYENTELNQEYLNKYGDVIAQLEAKDAQLEAKDAQLEARDALIAKYRSKFGEI